MFVNVLYDAAKEQQHQDIQSHTRPSNMLPITGDSAVVVNHFKINQSHFEPTQCTKYLEHSIDLNVTSLASSLSEASPASSTAVSL